jgi:cation diffusion facilitator CzcD-associated flavoprotein CzcO
MQEQMDREPSGDRVLDAVVVGSSQAGLALAWHLNRWGLRFVVLEAGARLGHVWRSRWDSLVPGLYFLGLSWQHTRGSTLVGFVEDDAAYLADCTWEHQAAATADARAARRP